jgi:alpha-N-acetylglucosamine transferase
MVIIIGCDDINGPDKMPQNTYKNNVLTQEYEEKAKNLLKSELKRRGVTYAQLVEKLAEKGLQETERNLANKISRGGFTGAFFIQCLDAIGCRSLQLSD